MSTFQGGKRKACKNTNQQLDVKALLVIILIIKGKENSCFIIVHSGKNNEK